MPDPGRKKYPEDIQAAIDHLARPDIAPEDKQRVAEQLDALGIDFDVPVEETVRFPSGMSEKDRPPEPVRFPDEKTPRPSYVYESQGPPLPSHMDPSGLTPRVREDLPDEFTPQEYSAKGALSAIMPDYVYEPRREPGEPRDAYKARADQAWRNQAQKAYEEGRAVKRQRATTGLEHGLTTGMAYLAPIAVGAERGYAMGMPGEVLRGEAMQNLEDMAAGKTDMPGMQELTGGTELLTALMPSSWTSRLMGRAAAGGVRTGSRVLDAAGRAATAAAGAGTDSLARSGIHAAGKALAGEEQDQSAQDVIDQAEESALLGMFLEPIMRGAQRLGLSRVNSLRAAPGSGHALNLIEKAGGGTVADVRNLSGLQPPAEVLRARELQAQPPASAAQVARNPALARRNMAAQDISVERATDALQGNIDSYRRAVPRAIEARDQPYLESPEGQAMVSMEPAIRRLYERITTGNGADGRPLPAEERLADQRLLAELMTGQFEEPGSHNQGPFTVEEARAMGLHFDEAPINEMASDNVGQQPLLMNPRRTSGVANGARNVPIVEHPPDAEYATPDELMGQGREMNLEPLVNREQRRLEEAGSVAVEPRYFNAQQLERAIRNYADRIRFANVRGDRTSGDNAMLAELIRMRREFGANEHAPAGRGGWAGLRAQDARQMQDLEAVLQSARLPRNLDEINFNDPAQRQALESLVRVYASEGGPNLNAIPAWRQFLAQRPGLERLLDTAAAHREIDALQGRVNTQARIGVSPGGGAHPYITNAAGFLKSRAYQLDPLMQELAGVTRGGRQPPADAADFPDGRGRSEKRAGQAAGPIKRYQTVKAKQKDEDDEKRRARRKLSP